MKKNTVILSKKEYDNLRDIELNYDDKIKALKSEHAKDLKELKDEHYKALEAGRTYHETKDTLHQKFLDLKPNDKVYVKKNIFFMGVPAKFGREVLLVKVIKNIKSKSEILVKERKTLVLYNYDSIII